ncbi:MAG: carboxypeptidase regulatory-like domain-containing protein [Acidimicrobiia bacterium]|nr:carboxypeptidase regulatory-like domain-containing protein [Acidimicrobiia bacterium]
MKRRLSERLRRATWRPVGDEARSRPLATIASAVAAGQQTVPKPVRRARRRLSAALVTASLIVLPTGIALAAEGSIPGDILYPVKKVTEKIRALVDEDVVAEHRVEELEKLVAADAPAEVIADQIDRATVEINRLEADQQLEERLEEATTGVAADRPLDDPPDRNGEGDGEPADKPATTTATTAAITDVSPASTTSTTAPRPGTTTTTTTKIDAATTTTVPVDTQRVAGYVHAGPTCPVVRFPPDPACDDLPVAGAVLVVTTEAGKELGRVESDVTGRFELGLPAGTYSLVPRPYDGLLGTAPAQDFVVEARPVELDVAYDTGIR